MTCVITGATGFIGQALLRELRSQGEKVVAVTRDPSAPNLDKGVDWRQFPRDVAGWDSILEGATIVYHFAWSSLPQTSNDDPLADASQNIMPAIMILEAARRKQKIRIVFASSGGTVYGSLRSVPASENHPTRPRCAYGVSKLAVEKYLTFYRDIWGIDSISLRIGNPYGPGQRVGRNFGAVSTFASRVVNGEALTIYGNGSVVRDYIYIADVVEALIAVRQAGGGATALNIGTGIGRSLNDIVDTLRTIPKSHIIEVKYVAARNFDVPISILDISLAQKELHWSPKVSFREGVLATFKALSSGSRVI